MAIDVLWTLISIQTWEKLVTERDWPNEQYVTKLKQMIQRVLITTP